VIGPANAGGDAFNSIKQAAELGIVPGSQKPVNLRTFINDVDGWGLRSTGHAARQRLHRPRRRNPGLVITLFATDQQAAVRRLRMTFKPSRSAEASEK
jgi:hypothetical protein